MARVPGACSSSSVQNSMEEDISELNESLSFDTKIGNTQSSEATPENKPSRKLQPNYVSSMLDIEQQRISIEERRLEIESQRL